MSRAYATYHHDGVFPFSRCFGPLRMHVLNNFQLAGFPDVPIVSNIKEGGTPIGLGDAGAFWHSDLSYMEQPSLGRTNTRPMTRCPRH